MNSRPLPTSTIADAIVVAVAHRAYLERSLGDYFQKIVKGGCFIDVKLVFDQKQLNNAGYKMWGL